MIIVAALTWLAGCNGVRDVIWGAPPERITADAFSADPVVTRLAIAVDRGDQIGRAHV